MEMINGGSEKAPYKATTPDRRGKKKKKNIIYIGICAEPPVYREFTNCEREEM